MQSLFFLQYGEVLKALGKYEEAKKWFLRYAQKYPVAGTQFAESCAFALSHRGDVPNYNIQGEYLNTSSSDFVSCAQINLTNPEPVANCRMVAQTHSLHSCCI